ATATTSPRSTARGEIEYPDNGGRQNFEDACRARGASTSIIYRDRAVAPAGSAEYVYESC
ncbi:MAG TPA: hypothetical protein VEB43_04630, partial [Anaeromyxobacter sp.]|nr:hypothetical protein [Anaeromyxobacter sp.]